jgi:hypothetical protein
MAKNKNVLNASKELLRIDFVIGDDNNEYNSKRIAKGHRSIG